MKKALLIMICLFLTVPVLAEEAKNAPILEVKLKRWDERTLEKAFLDGRDVEMEKDGYEEHGTLEYCEYDTSRTAGYIPQTGQYAYALKIGAEADGYLSFRSMGVSMDDSFVLISCDMGEPMKGEIEGFSLDDAVGILNDRLSLIGVGTGEIFRYSAIKRDDFEELRRKYGKRRRDEYSEYESVEAGLLREKATLDGFLGQTPPDDGYLIRIAKSCEGTVCQLPLSWKRSFDSDSTYILAYVTASGVQYLDTEEVFDVVRQKTPSKTPISRDKAERIFRKQLLYKSSHKASDKTEVITRVAYEDAPVAKKKTVYLRPAWCFYAQADEISAGYDWYIVGAVDAYTGKVL